MVIAHLGRRGRRDAHVWGLPFALAAGFTVAFIGISGKLNIPPTQGQEWLVVTAAGAVVVSIIASISDRARWAVIGLSIALLIAMTWFITANKRHWMTTREAATAVAFIAGGLVLWWAAM